jgi:hypothetical protein
VFQAIGVDKRLMLLILSCLDKLELRSDASRSEERLVKEVVLVQRHGRPALLIRKLMAGANISFSDWLR